MRARSSADSWAEKRSQPRNLVNKAYLARLSTDNFSKTYRIRVWDKAVGSLSLLTYGETEFLPDLEEGKIIQIMYRPLHSAWPCMLVRASIRHITTKSAHRGNRQYAIGLEVLERKDSSGKGSILFCLDDNGGRRLKIDRRRFTYTRHFPERRTGKERRTLKERRKGKLDMKNYAIERRSEFFFSQ